MFQSLLDSLAEKTLNVGFPGLYNAAGARWRELEGSGLNPPGGGSLIENTGP
ncbi:hypothetical protein H4V99_003351 [Cryobacterium sp. CG_9.6]|nr:hypothetical protein [Cryobacterium sp. CG_9.6]